MSNARRVDAIPLRIIGTMADSRTKSLRRALASSFECDVIDPVYLGDEEFSRLESATRMRFRARMGRFPSRGEIGCAMAHLNAYGSFLRTSAGWCLVLEDDAGICDPEAVADRCQAVINATDASTRLIWSFYTADYAPGSFARPGPLPGSTTSPIAPTHTVAYLISRSAAQYLVANQEALPRLADWPVGGNRIRFVVDHTKLVEHGRPSTEGGTRPAVFVPTGVPRLRRLRKWSGLWYLSNTRYFGSPADYWFTQILPAVGRLSAIWANRAPR